MKRELERRGHTEVQGQLVYGNCNIHSQIIGDMQAELNELRKYREMYGTSMKDIQRTTITTDHRIVEADHSKCQA